MDILTTIYAVIIWICFGYSIYNVVLFVVGMIFCKVKYPMAEDNRKFCIFVPSHNEEAVIGATIDNLNKINYSADLFDIYFIADNCADHTANAMREAIEKAGRTNFHVLERNNSPMDKRGKPHALRWAIETLEEANSFYNKYDMLFIIDSDNFVDADILKHVNSQYLSYKEGKRPCMIQTYLDSKNKKGVIAKGYFATYRLMSTLWETAKQKLHLVPQIGGTGFAIETSFLHEIGGFNCKSLTEDLEISAIATIRNRTIAFNPNVRIYDEKPTHLKQSLVQRTRWAQGHWYVSFKFIPRLLIQIFNPKSIKNIFRKIDMIIYLLARFFCILTCISLIYPVIMYFVYADYSSVQAFFDYFKNPSIDMNPVTSQHHWVLWVSFICAILAFIALPIAVLIAGTKEEKKHLLIDLIPNIVCLYLVSIFDLITTWPGLFMSYNQKVWKKTQHSITEIKN